MPKINSRKPPHTPDTKNAKNERGGETSAFEEAVNRVRQKWGENMASQTSGDEIKSELLAAQAKTEEFFRLIGSVNPSEREGLIENARKMGYIGEDIHAELISAVEHKNVPTETVPNVKERIADLLKTLENEFASAENLTRKEKEAFIFKRDLLEKISGSADPHKEIDDAFAGGNLSREDYFALTKGGEGPTIEPPPAAPASGIGTGEGATSEGAGKVEEAGAAAEAEAGKAVETAGAEATGAGTGATEAGKAEKPVSSLSLGEGGKVTEQITPELEITYEEPAKLRTKQTKPIEMEGIIEPLKLTPEQEKWVEFLKTQKINNPTLEQAKETIETMKEAVVSNPNLKPELEKLEKDIDELIKRRLALMVIAATEGVSPDQLQKYILENLDKRDRTPEEEQQLTVAMKRIEEAAELLDPVLLAMRIANEKTNDGGKFEQQIELLGKAINPQTLEDLKGKMVLKGHVSLLLERLQKSQFPALQMLKEIAGDTEFENLKIDLMDALSAKKDEKEKRQEVDKLIAEGMVKATAMTLENKQLWEDLQKRTEREREPWNPASIEQAPPPLTPEQQAEAAKMKAEIRSFAWRILEKKTSTVEEGYNPPPGFEKAAGEFLETRSEVLKTYKEWYQAKKSLNDLRDIPEGDIAADAKVQRINLEKHCKKAEEAANAKYKAAHERLKREFTDEKFRRKKKEFEEKFPGQSWTKQQEAEEYKLITGNTTHETAMFLDQEMERLQTEQLPKRERGVMQRFGEWFSKKSKLQKVLISALAAAGIAAFTAAVLPAAWLAFLAPSTAAAWGTMTLGTFVGWRILRGAVGSVIGAKLGASWGAAMERKFGKEEKQARETRSAEAMAKLDEVLGVDTHDWMESEEKRLKMMEEMNKLAAENVKKTKARAKREGRWRFWGTIGAGIIGGGAGAAIFDVYMLPSLAPELFVKPGTGTAGITPSGEEIPEMAIPEAKDAGTPLYGGEPGGEGLEQPATPLYGGEPGGEGLEQSAGAGVAGAGVPDGENVFEPVGPQPQGLAAGAPTEGGVRPGAGAGTGGAAAESGIGGRPGGGGVAAEAGASGGGPKTGFERPGGPIPTLEEVEAKMRQLAQGPEAFTAGKGDSIWTLSDRQLQGLGGKFGNEFQNFNKAQQIYVIDAIKDRAVENPARFGLPESVKQNPNLIQIGQRMDMSSILNDQAEMEKIFVGARGLNAAQMENILGYKPSAAGVVPETTTGVKISGEGQPPSNVEIGTYEGTPEVTPEQLQKQIRQLQEQLTEIRKNIASQENLDKVTPKKLTEQMQQLQEQLTELEKRGSETIVHRPSPGPVDSSIKLQPEERLIKIPDAGTYTENLFGTRMETAVAKSINFTLEEYLAIKDVTVERLLAEIPSKDMGWEIFSGRVPGRSINLPSDGVLGFPEFWKQTELAEFIRSWDPGGGTEKLTVAQFLRIVPNK